MDAPEAVQVRVGSPEVKLNVQTLEALPPAPQVVASISVESKVKSLAVMSIPVPPVALVSSEISNLFRVITWPEIVI